MISKRVNAPHTPAEPSPDLQLEIAHLLLLDVVGYSKLLVEEQVHLIKELTETVRATECFRNAVRNGKLIRVPTGDGMALAFVSSPEEPAWCALEISRALQDRPQIQLRMGIHNGPVNRIVEVNEKTNVAGSGITSICSTPKVNSEKIRSATPRVLELTSRVLKSHAVAAI
jgi:hypothetical protein